MIFRFQLRGWGVGLGVGGLGLGVWGVVIGFLSGCIMRFAGNRGWQTCGVLVSEGGGGVMAQSIALDWQDSSNMKYNCA